MKESRPRKTYLLQVVFFWAFFFSFLLVQYPAQALADIASNHQKYIQHGGFALMFDNKLLREHQGNGSFIPASTIKLATNLAALKILGPHYRFSTDFYLDKDSNLYIQGGGDPFLVSENIALIGQQLLQKGLNRIGTLILDTSLFSLEGPVDGSNNTSNPYDVTNDALGVNFNTLPINVSNTGAIASDEPQTPLLPIMEDIGRHLGSGQHRVNVDAFPASSGIPNRYRYAGELFLAILQKNGITTGMNIKVGEVPAEAQHVHTYHSEQTVEELIRMNLKFSNNFISNQLFLTCGSKQFGLPATWEKGRRSLARFLLEEIGLKERDIRLTEGSGLSRLNRATPRAMLKILHSFRPYAHLLPIRQGVRVKSGTLKEVYSYAGYFQYDRQLDPFVILLNQKKNTRDRILELLLEEHTKNHQDPQKNP